MKHYLLILTTLIFAACNTEPSQDGLTESNDAADDCALCKDDIFGFDETSAEAKGILEVANTLTEQQLDDNVKLDSRAAKYIIEYRADKGDIPTLLELDGILFVGQSAFNNLYTYAQDNGYIDEDYAEIVDPLQCVNGVQDGDEIGVDCGGHCYTPCNEPAMAQCDDVQNITPTQCRALIELYYAGGHELYKSSYIEDVLSGDLCKIPGISCSGNYFSLRSEARSKKKVNIPFSFISLIMINEINLRSVDVFLTKMILIT